jgi:hypothetical protein
MFINIGRYSAEYLDELTAENLRALRVYIPG